MDGLLIEMAADKLGPRKGNIIVFAAADTLTHPYALFYSVDFAQGRFVSIIANADLYYKWGSNSDEVDETATGTGDKVCDFLPANTKEEHIPTGTHLIAKASAPCKIRIVVTSGRGRREGG